MGVIVACRSAIDKMLSVESRSGVVVCSKILSVICDLWLTGSRLVAE